VTPNLTAFLAMVAQCEVGTADKTGYRVLYGGGWFDSYDDHPRQKITAGKYTSTAAGRYQILAGTWDDFIKAEGPHRFDEDGQNLCARWLINRRGATADVEAGRLRGAIAKCGKEWASLPGSPYGQPVRTLDYCERVYAAHGGSQIDGNTTYRVERPTVPIEPATAPDKGARMGPFALTALPAILQMIPSLFGALGGDKGEKNAKIAQVVVDTFTAAVPGAANVQEAVEKAQADPVVRAQAVAAVEANPFVQHLVEVGGGIGGAREEYAQINADYENDPPWRILAKFVANPVHWVTGVFLWFVQQFIPPLAQKTATLDAAAAMGLIVLIFGVIAVVGARWMGTYQQKQKED
jgi:muramidase (phage lysozyme)